MAWKGLQICAISCKASRDTNQRYGLQVTPRGYKQDLLPILAIQIEDLHGMLAQQVGVRHVTQALLANLQRTSLICKPCLWHGKRVTIAPLQSMLCKGAMVTRFPCQRQGLHIKDVLCKFASKAWVTCLTPTCCANMPCKSSICMARMGNKSCLYPLGVTCKPYL